MECVDPFLVRKVSITVLFLLSFGCRQDGGLHLRRKKSKTEEKPFTLLFNFAIFLYFWNERGSTLAT